MNSLPTYAARLDEDLPETRGQPPVETDIHPLNGS
jgi:hypothetical protein